MDPDLKMAVVEDLDRSAKRREFYQRVGKVWNRQYLLCGPPGTGKSSLIAPMVSSLCYSTRKQTKRLGQRQGCRCSVWRKTDRPPLEEEAA
ncbi:PREDICTED: AAA-ATPase [Prunus dulcis]|uniref:PREDICTED: AAA-ATPase n=1 Tax=Prunus dulcis TaxID=3755 RepID=A0A5E4FJ27_PRUDU|nr:PREDICTED: AAA-ATPase [Prunus dulcis]